MRLWWQFRLSAVIMSSIAWVVSSVMTPASGIEPFFVTSEDRDYWAFQPACRPIVPEIEFNDHPQSPLNHFVWTRREAQGIRAVQTATRHELIRRVTYDLIGLPPTPEQVEAFENDISPHAFAYVVERLLNSPHYGERWARYWLDIARFSENDVYGPLRNSEYQNAWRYRD